MSIHFSHLVVLTKYSMYLQALKQQQSPKPAGAAPAQQPQVKKEGAPPAAGKPQQQQQQNKNKKQKQKANGFQKK